MKPLCFRLTYADGKDAGDFETSFSIWCVGDTFRTGDGRRLRIRAMLPLDLIEAFADGPVVAIWEVETV